MSLLSSQRHYAFDLDGTVFDTRHHVEAAYASVGVMMPAGAWGRTWEEWLIPQCDGDRLLASQLHAKKVQVYDQLLQDQPPELTAAGELLLLMSTKERVLGADFETSVMTGASRGAMNRLLAQAGIVTRSLAHLTVEQKTERLRLLSHGRCRVTYVDDDVVALAVMRQKLPANVRLIHFHGQDALALRKEVW
jgi:FMN phosphatase YigB (HAD superfamily)